MLRCVNNVMTLGAYPWIQQDYNAQTRGTMVGPILGAYPWIQQDYNIILSCGSSVVTLGAYPWIQQDYNHVIRVQNVI